MKLDTTIVLFFRNLSDSLSSSLGSDSHSTSVWSPSTLSSAPSLSWPNRSPHQNVGATIRDSLKGRKIEHHHHHHWLRATQRERGTTQLQQVQKQQHTTYKVALVDGDDDDESERRPQGPTDEFSPDLGILSYGGLREYSISSEDSTTGGRFINFLGSLSSFSPPKDSIRDMNNIEQRMLQYQENDEDTVKDEEYTSNESAVANEGQVLTPSPSYSYYAPYRRWEEVYYSFCKDDDPYLYRWRTNCTCTNVDRDNYTLSVVCGGNIQCFNSSSKCGIRYEKCEYKFNGYQFTGEEGSLSRERCFERNDVRMCYTYYMDVDRIETLNINRESLVGCGRKVNGVLCKSCNITQEVKYRDCDDYKNLSTCAQLAHITCFNFDCTNTALNRTGSSCDPDYHRDSGSFYGCDLNCNICGAVWDNATMTLPDEEIIIPFSYFSKILCSQSQRYASEGYLTTDGCHAIQQLAIGKCGCEGNASNETVSETPPAKAAAGDMRKDGPINRMIAFLSTTSVICWLFSVE